MDRTKRLSLATLAVLWLLLTAQTWINGNPVVNYVYYRGVATASLQACTAALEGTTAYDSTTSTLKTCTGGSWVNAGATISGLTTNKIPKATSATAIGDSSISDDGTRVLLGAGIPLRAAQSSSTPMVIVGVDAAPDTDVTDHAMPNLQSVANQTTANFDAVRTGAGAGGALLWAFKTRATDTSAGTVVVADDDLLEITSYGADGTNYVRAGRILIESDGTPGTNDMPGRMSFWTTPDGSATVTEQWRINNAGSLYRKSSGSQTGVVQIDRSADANLLYRLDDDGSGNATITLGQYGKLSTANGSLHLSPSGGTICAGNGALSSNDCRNASPLSVLLRGTAGLGTDVAGGTMTIASGPGSGAGIGGDVVTQTAPPATSGSSENSLGDRSRVLAKYTTLTESTATAFARVAVAAGTVIGGEAVVTVEANDATDYQARTLRFGFSAVNKAGTTTTGIDTPSESVAVSAGTLTCTITAVDATANVDLKANCVSSLTQTTLRANAVVTAKNFGTGAISAQ